METRQGEIEKKLNKILEKIKHIDDINRNVSTLNSKIESVILELNDLRVTVNENDKDLSSLKKTVTYLEAENRFLREDLKNLRMSNEEQLNLQNENILEIVGLPEIISGNVSEVIERFVKKK